MISEIKRMRFFDGQFLQELEFQDEQFYHLHMRRRQNYLLFQDPGVIEIGPNDLMVEAVNVGAKTFRVKAGTAIALDDTAQEGIEIVLLSDTPVQSLSDHGITPGEVAVIALMHEEVEEKDPASAGSVDEDTRVKEKGILVVFSQADGPPAGLTRFVILGTIPFNAGLPDFAARQFAHIRPSLLGVSAGPSISGISPTSIPANSSNVAVTITGTNLSNAISVNFPGEPEITVIPGISSTPTTVTLSINVGAGVTPGQKSFTVTTQTGIAESPPNVILTIEEATAPNLQSIDISPDNQTIDVGSTLILRAVGTFDDSSTALVMANWSSSDPAIVSLSSSSGRTVTVTGVSAGSAQISASTQGISDTTDVTVSVPVPAPIINPVTPFDPTSGRPSNDPSNPTIIKIFGSNFGVDLPSLPTVTLIDRNNTIDDIQPNVENATDTEIDFAIPQIAGQTTSVDMTIRVTTSGGSVNSPANPPFRWRPPL